MTGLRSRRRRTGALSVRFLLRRRALFAADQGRVKRRQELQAVDGFLAQMDAAGKQDDAATFFLPACQSDIAWLGTQT